MSVPWPTSGSYPIRDGNSVQPLIDGVPTFRRIGEAIERAQNSIWLTVAFCAPDFVMPDGRGALFDVLDRAVARGLDVRVIFWRPKPKSIGLGRTFAGSPADRDVLRKRGSRFLARWDRAHGHFLHHQKSWLIDAGEASEVAFIGGINLTAQAVGPPATLRETATMFMSRCAGQLRPTRIITSFNGGMRPAIANWRAEGGVLAPKANFRFPRLFPIHRAAASYKSSAMWMLGITATAPLAREALRILSPKASTRSSINTCVDQHDFCVDVDISAVALSIQTSDAAKSNLLIGTEPG